MRKHILGHLENNMYQIGENEVAIIDAPEGASEALNQDLNVRYVFLTHLHYDHILGLLNLAEKFPNAEIVFNPLELEFLIEGSLSEELVTFLEKQALQMKDEYSLDSEVIKIINTPGHTAGGISLLYKDMLFSGDTLFHLEIGRTDLPGGDYKTEIESVKYLVENLDENIMVHPGHGVDSTIKAEKSNPYLV